MAAELHLLAPPGTAPPRLPRDWTVEQHPGGIVALGPDGRGQRIRIGPSHDLPELFRLANAYAT